MAGLPDHNGFCTKAEGRGTTAGQRAPLVATANRGIQGHVPPMTEHPWSAVETNPQCEDNRMLAQESGWCAVITRPQHEEVAEKAMIDAGYDVWLPRYKKRLRGVKMVDGRRVRSKSDGFIERPLIRGYVFLLLAYGDEAWAVDGLNGIHRVMRHRDVEGYPAAPKRIRGRVLEQLREAVDAGLFDEVSIIDKVISVQVGDRVITPSGIVATLLTLDEKGRADLLANMFGAERLMRKVDAAVLELVS